MQSAEEIKKKIEELDQEIESVFTKGYEPTIASGVRKALLWQRRDLDKILTQQLEVDHISREVDRLKADMSDWYRKVAIAGILVFVVTWTIIYMVRFG